MNAPEAPALLQPWALTQSWDRPSARDWARVLAAFPLFSGVGMRRLRKLVGKATFAEFAAGDTIRANRDDADFLYVILGGSAKAIRPSGARALGIGDFVGETAVATQELHVVKLPRRSIPGLVLSRLAGQGRRADTARELAPESLSCVEGLQERLRMLVAQRQALRERNAGRDELESNRLELASRQRDLSQALIDRYLPQAEREAA